MKCYRTWYIQNRYHGCKNKFSHGYIFSRPSNVFDLHLHLTKHAPNHWILREFARSVRKSLHNSESQPQTGSHVPIPRNLLQGLRSQGHKRNEYYGSDGFCDSCISQNPTGDILTPLRQPAAAASYRPSQYFVPEILSSRTRRGMVNDVQSTGSGADNSRAEQGAPIPQALRETQNDNVQAQAAADAQALVHYDNVQLKTAVDSRVAAHAQTLARAEATRSLQVRVRRVQNHLEQSCSIADQQAIQNMQNMSSQGVPNYIPPENNVAFSSMNDRTHAQDQQEQYFPSIHAPPRYLGEPDVKSGFFTEAMHFHDEQGGPAYYMWTCCNCGQGGNTTIVLEGCAKCGHIHCPDCPDSLPA
ncbi:hypothetical protein B0O99DRAFT_243499 [Bisporella sp. PMI_857]|nr:hypothetical protein B0O99DRAFT_243499 [Bisporella sp. PMI_857]